LILLAYKTDLDRSLMFLAIAWFLIMRDSKSISFSYSSAYFSNAYISGGVQLSSATPDNELSRKYSFTFCVWNLFTHWPMRRACCSKKLLACWTCYSP